MHQVLRRREYQTLGVEPTSFAQFAIAGPGSQSGRILTPCRACRCAANRTCTCATCPMDGGVSRIVKEILDFLETGGNS
jgi:hypothetical protein